MSSSIKKSSIPTSSMQVQWNGVPSQSFLPQQGIRQRDPLSHLFVLTMERLGPKRPQGYSRLGAAHLGLHQYQEAVSAYKKGLEIDPNNEALKSGLADAQSAATASTSRAMVFLQQPDFVNAVQEIQRNPSKLNEHLKDQRVPEAETPSPPPPSQPAKEESKKPKPVPKPEPMEIAEEEKEKKEKRLKL
ncbi:hypothetical protein F3Y22_tig00110602pilonHSYRG00238 [Hibiscus syriacus]|uniref:STI1/HOP DP domain-containing protein n=1 Tax=Hibiscus syriacus TaxID=106335 RepID=A0A6A3A1U4_HIBSY|nr:hypothetical protein F3Y22_tig00110602pilonHSYRG00238 [Hibiscus syriacus]